MASASLESKPVFVTKIKVLTGEHTSASAWYIITNLRNLYLITINFRFDLCNICSFVCATEKIVYTFLITVNTRHMRFITLHA